MSRRRWSLNDALRPPSSRSSRRFRVALSAHYFLGSDGGRSREASACTVDNLSVSGARVDQAPAIPELGARVALELKLFEHGAPQLFPGTCAWVEQATFGVRFESLSAGTRRLLQDILPRLENRRAQRGA